MTPPTHTHTIHPQHKHPLPPHRTLIREGLTPPCLVFVSSKERAVELHRELMYDGGMRVDSIHADQPVAQRNAAVDNFRAGRTWVLIATDLLGVCVVCRERWVLRLWMV